MVETGDQPVLTKSVTMHRLAATESFLPRAMQEEYFGFFVLLHAGPIRFLTTEDIVCSRQVYGYLLRYARHLE
jgi:hypothetical protein